MKEAIEQSAQTYTRGGIADQARATQVAKPDAEHSPMRNGIHYETAKDHDDTIEHDDDDDTIVCVRPHCLHFEIGSESEDHNDTPAASVSLTAANEACVQSTINQPINNQQSSKTNADPNTQGDRFAFTTLHS